MGPPPPQGRGDRGPLLALAAVVVLTLLAGRQATCLRAVRPPPSTRAGTTEPSRGRGQLSTPAPAARRPPAASGPSTSAAAASASASGAAGPAAARGSARGSGDGDDDGVASTPGDQDAGTGGAPGKKACSGLACNVTACPRGGSTTIRGTVYDPAGKRALYGVVVYVPSTPPAPLPAGATCLRCEDYYTGGPVTSAVTDALGHFTLQSAPDGADVPLVLQVGKWRRQIVLPRVDRCAETVVPEGTLTLPKNGREGDLPSIAVSTGGADTIECLLRRMGVDEAEYVPGAGGGGHVHVFKGDDTAPGPTWGRYPAPDTRPGAPRSAAALWGSAADLLRYDVVVLSCEAQVPAGMNQRALFDYAAAGGRVFASHYHYAWFDTGPFGAANLAAWSAGTYQAGWSLGASVVTTTWAGQPFPRGQALFDWLSAAGALTGGQLPIDTPSRSNATVTAANTGSQPWIVAGNHPVSPGAAQVFSFDTPIGAAPGDQCGRVVFSDVHVGPAAGDYGGSLGTITPAGCGARDLSPQEKALEFVLFDLSSCVTPGNAPQAPPSAD